jgi:hypothetical protein
VYPTSDNRFAERVTTLAPDPFCVAAALPPSEPAPEPLFVSWKVIEYVSAIQFAVRVTGPAGEYGQEISFPDESFHLEKI